MTKKIKEIGLAKFTNAEQLGFHLEVLVFLNICGVENIACTTERPLYDAAILEEVDIVKRQRASSLTADLEQLDKQRDELLSFIFATLDAAKHSPIEAAKEAHKQLLPVMKPYRGIAYNTHIQESSEIIGLIKDLSANHLATYVESLNIVDALIMLQTKNNEYIQLDSQRISEMPSKVETDSLRKTVDTLYNTIVDKINATVILTPNESAITLVENLNNFINQINTSYNMRLAHTKKEKDTGVNTTTPTTPEEETI